VVLIALLLLAPAVLFLILGLTRRTWAWFALAVWLVFLYFLPNLVPAVYVEAGLLERLETAARWLVWRLGLVSQPD